MPYRGVKYRFDIYSQQNGKKNAFNNDDSELYDNGLILSGLRAEEILVGKVKTRNDIHGVLTSEQFCKIAIEETEDEEKRNRYVVKEFIRDALTDFGQQVIDQARENAPFFLKYGYLTPAQFKDIESGKMPSPYKVGLRGFTLNRCLQNTIREIKIGLGATKIRARLEGILSPSLMKNDIRTLCEEMTILRSEQDEEKPSSPKCQLGENLIFDVNMRFGGKDALKNQGLEVRFYSSSQTLMDFAGGIDCWVELFDFNKKIAMETFGVDVTYNDEKHDEMRVGKNERKMADFVFFYSLQDMEPAISDDRDSFNWKVTPHFYESKSYISLVEGIVEMFKKHIKGNSQPPLDQNSPLEYTSDPS
jgi:hypothetical protein